MHWCIFEWRPSCDLKSSVKMPEILFFYCLSLIMLSDNFHSQTLLIFPLRKVSNIFILVHNSECVRLPCHSSPNVRFADIQHLQTLLKSPNCVTCWLRDGVWQRNLFNQFYLNAALPLSLLTPIIWLAVARPADAADVTMRFAAGVMRGMTF